MNTRRAFELAIAKDPYDGEARRVFADWLEENGLDGEAFEQRRWTPEWQRAHDWLLKFCETSGATLDEMAEAVKRYLETGEEVQIGSDWLGFGAVNQFVSESFLEQFWDSWETWTRTKVNLDNKQHEPFGCCI